MKLLFTICGRAGSKGVANKNIRNLLGAPLVYYTLAAYELYKIKYGSAYERIDMAINTDSDILVEQVKKTGVDHIYIKRKDELSGDSVSKPSVIRDTILETEKLVKENYDIIVDLDLTSPIRTIDDINKIILALKENEDTDISFTMTHSRRSPYFNQVFKKNDEFYSTIIKSDFVTRQEAPTCYDMNASIYGYRREYILNKMTRSVFDGNAMGVLVKDTAVLDIDNEEDLELMSVLAVYFFNNYTEYDEIHKRATTLLK